MNGNDGRGDHFFDVQDIFPELLKIHPLRTAIMAELKSVLSQPENLVYWPEKNLYNGPPGSDWKIFPFYVDFQGTPNLWSEENCRKMPTLSGFIRSEPVRTNSTFQPVTCYVTCIRRQSKQLVVSDSSSMKSAISARPESTAVTTLQAGKGSTTLASDQERTAA